MWHQGKRVGPGRQLRAGAGWRIDHRTVAIYEDRAADYARARPPAHTARARALAGAAIGRLPVVDLGCGPGGYAGDLASTGRGVVGIDAAASMLALARPGERVVRADLAALPFGRGTLGGAWSRNAHLHLPAAELPLAMAHLHHALAVGAPLAMAMVAGPDFVAEDDLPGRAFTGWAPDDLARVVTGGGFADVVVEEGTGGALWVTGRRARTLPDFVGPGMRLLVCGLNPSEVAADAGYGFAGPTNRFWPAAVAAGVVGRPRDPWRALAVDRVGMTDLVKRATRRASALDRQEYRAGFERVAALVAWLRPAVLCLVGLEGWRAAVDRRATAGWQPTAVGGVPTYVMPSTSGLNAHASSADLAGHLRAAVGGPG